jgi:hypothetical protein
MSDLASYASAKYEGPVDFNGKWRGKGTLVYADGTKYEGDFVDGMVRERVCLSFRPFDSCEIWRCCAHR